jgi:hypothetical protein
MAFAVVLTVVLFVLSGIGKVANARVSQEQRDALSVPPGLWRTIGVLELLGALGVVGAWLGVVPIWLGQAAAIGFVLLIVGAIVTRLRAKSPVGMLLMDVVTIVLSVMTLVALRGR